MKRYSKEHEWIELDGTNATIGITAHAAEELGDITFVELPAVGEAFAQNAVLLVIESVKAAADVYCPVAGTVAAINEELNDHPERINESPEADGWLCRLSGVNAAQFNALMTLDQYLAFIKK
jgi:glycine cleavage system H protein